MASKAIVRQRNIRIYQRALRLLHDCKVPRFSSTVDDPADLEQQQYDWSDEVAPMLRRLVCFLERYRSALFGEDCCGHRSSRLFRKYFLLVYFEQISANFERADYQADIFELERRLTQFAGEVHHLLTKESYWGLRNRLFHHYGCLLAAEEGWQNQPGELYGFVRFVVSSTRDSKVSVDSRMLAFAETFGLRLLGKRQNEDYQTLGITLLNASMRYAYRNHSYTKNAEEILALVIRIICIRSEESEEELFDIAYYSVRSIRIPNRSMDDEVMRTLVSLLVQDEDNADIYLKILIRILLLDIPEVEMDGWDCDKFTISGRDTDAAGFRLHLLERHQQSAPPSDGGGRFSIRWKLYIGQMMPKLVGRMVRFPDEGFSFEHSGTKAVGVLAWLVMFPVGQSFHRKYARTAMLCGMMDELLTGLINLWPILQERQDVGSLQSISRLCQDAFLLFRPILAGITILFIEWQQARQSALDDRTRTRFTAIMNSLELRMTGMEMVIRCIVEICDQLVQSVNITSCLQSNRSNH